MGSHTPGGRPMLFASSTLFCRSSQHVGLGPCSKYNQGPVWCPLGLESSQDTAGHAVMATAHLSSPPSQMVPPAYCPSRASPCSPADFLGLFCHSARGGGLCQTPPATDLPVLHKQMDQSGPGPEGAGGLLFAHRTKPSMAQEFPSSFPVTPFSCHMPDPQPHGATSC